MDKNTKNYLILNKNVIVLNKIPPGAPGGVVSCLAKGVRRDVIRAYRALRSS